MYFSRTDSVFLSQILHISMWHHSGTGGPIRIFKRAKSIRIKFPKPWAYCPTMEIICCSGRLNLMSQNGYWRPLQSLKTDEHPSNEDLFFGRLLGNSFEDDHNHQHNHHSYHHHHHHILNIQGEEFKQFRCPWNPLQALQRVTTDGHPPNEELLPEVFWANSFEVDHYHHHNHHHHHQQHVPHILEEVYEHLSCWSDPPWALRSVTTNGHPPNEEFLSNVFWRIL